MANHPLAITPGAFLNMIVKISSAIDHIEEYIEKNDKNLDKNELCYLKAIILGLQTSIEVIKPLKYDSSIVDSAIDFFRNNNNYRKRMSLKNYMDSSNG